MRKISFLWIFVAVISVALSACGDKSEPLIVYAGKGLRLAMEDVKSEFERKHKIPVSIVYAGSGTLLSTIKNTSRGDIYVPGSQGYIKEAGDLIVESHFVGYHVPVVAIGPGSSHKLHSYTDLLLPGVKIAVANGEMAAIGKISEDILKAAGPENSFQTNIVIQSSTVNELLAMVSQGNVDAAIVWSDMLLWDSAKNLKPIPIPDQLNQIKEIHVGVLTTSRNVDDAKLFASFMSQQGREIFAAHGFAKQ